MSPEIPRNVKVGQIRRTVGVVTEAEWSRLAGDERDAADALALHIWWRCRQTLHPALEGTDGIFLTVRYVQRLLRAVGAAKKGEKAAAAAIKTMVVHGWIVDTGQVKKPRRPEQSIARAECFQPEGNVQSEGGKDAQPLQHSFFWWRIFRVPTLAHVMEAVLPKGAYGQFRTVPQHLASLSAYLKRQGLISRPGRRTQANRGSVQWVFQHSGPP